MESRNNEEKSFWEWFKKDFPKLFVDTYFKYRDTLVKATQDHLVLPSVFTSFTLFKPAPRLPPSMEPPAPDMNKNHNKSNN